MLARKRSKILAVLIAMLLVATMGHAVTTKSAADAAGAPSPLQAANSARNRAAQIAIVFAYSQLNKPYINDANRFGPNHYDCSGLVWAAYAHAMKNLGAPNLGLGDRWTKSIVMDPQLRAVPFASARPGDLIFYITDDPRFALGHVGIFVGNQYIIDATTRTGRVTLEPVSAPFSSPHVKGIWPYAYAIR